jgi:hypothetical protein
VRQRFATVSLGESLRIAQVAVNEVFKYVFHGVSLSSSEI